MRQCSPVDSHASSYHDSLAMCSLNKGLISNYARRAVQSPPMAGPKVKLDAAALEAFRALGRIGGKKGGPKGGKARWKGVSAEERRAHARKAAAARWRKRET